MTLYVRKITRHESDALDRWRRADNVVRYGRARIVRLSANGEQPASPMAHLQRRTRSGSGRDMAPEAGGDSLHVGLDGGALSSASDLTAYMETVAGATTVVIRTFDTANRLAVSREAGVGLTSYNYDDNGNLVKLIEPQMINQAQRSYTCNRRNLLVEAYHQTG